MIFLKTEIKAPRIISEQHILAHDVTELYLKRDFNATVISDQLTWKPPNLLPKEHSKRQKIPLEGDFGCPELVFKSVLVQTFAEVT